MGVLKSLLLFSCYSLKREWEWEWEWELCIEVNIVTK